MENKKTNSDLEKWIDQISVRSPYPSSDYSAEKSFFRLNKRIHENSRLTRSDYRRIGFYRIGLTAAIAALLITIGGWIHTSSLPTPTLQVATNHSNIVKSISLPDGTIIKLNNGSQLIYPEHFSSKEREVFLDGEAYFDVAHDKKHPFVVRIGDLKIRVLGTKFTVNSKSSSSFITATLLEGSIEVYDHTNRLLMTPNQQLTYDINNKKMNLSTVNDTKSEISWTENIWILSNTPLLEVCQRLEKQFNIEFIIMNEDLINKSFTGQFHTNESLESILETLQMSTPFKYEYKDKHIIFK